jgi:hypothetical protein
MQKAKKAPVQLENRATKLRLDGTSDNRAKLLYSSLWKTKINGINSRGTKLRKMYIIMLVVILLSPFLSSASAKPQSRSIRPQKDSSETDLKYAGVINYNLDSITYNDLKCALCSDIIYKVPEIFFDSIQNPQLANLICFADYTGPSKKPVTNICLQKAGKRYDFLFGAEYVYVMMFAHIDSGAIRCTAKAADSTNKRNRETVKSGKSPGSEGFADLDSCMLAKVRHSQLENRRGAGELAVLSSLNIIVNKLIGSTPPTEQDHSEPRDTAFWINYDTLRCDTSAIVDGKILLYATTKIHLKDNTIDGIGVRPYAKASEEFYIRFANYSPSRIGTSVGLSLSRSEAGAKNDNDSLNVPQGFQPLWSLEPEPFLFFNYFIVPPKLPSLHGQRSFSVSAVLGVKIGLDDFPEDLFLGCGIGHLGRGIPQIIGGLNFAQFKSRSGRYYKWEGMLAIAYEL